MIEQGRGEGGREQGEFSDGDSTQEENERVRRKFSQGLKPLGVTVRLGAGDFGEREASPLRPSPCTLASSNDRLKLEIVPVYPLKMEPKMLSAAMTLRIMRKLR